ncbi:DUF6174 domain-containing protein [Deinococcus sp.]|uniref:DUF6174 domain-containing protein n=1 Tax=Deinococcus sp. TaxID=47478 RepID=UPI003B5B711D
MRPLLLVPLLLGLSSCGLGNLVSGCRSDYVRPNFAALQRDLSAARVRWQTTNVQNYRYDFSQFAAPVGFPPIRVTVTGGVVSSTENLDDRPGPSAASFGATIEQRFDEIAQGLSASKNEQCELFSVDFDVSDGHPLKRLSGTAKRGLEDGFGQWEIGNFTRL